jgi:MoxR-like ATPase
MYTVNTKDYAQLLRTCEAIKQPLFVQGGFGIGKSAIPRQVFAQLAKERKLEYVEWSDLENDKKEEVLSNPGDYYVFMDARTSQMDTTSLQGIPNMNKTERLENIPYSWVVYFTHPDAHGSIFFDEINLAAPIVQSITYSAIQDRVISDRRLAKDVFVFAAGNRQQDRAHTFDMPMPLRDRFAECEVTHDADEWVEWAIQNKVNTHLINFVRWKKSYLYNYKPEVKTKPSTPRGIHRASNLIKHLDMNDREAAAAIHQLVSISAGEGFATEFQAYTTVYQTLNWKTLFEKPSTIADMSIDKQYAIAGGLVERFQDKPNDKDLFSKLAECAYNLKKDLAVFCFRSMKEFDVKAFGDILRETGENKNVISKYGKFLVETPQAK